MKALILACALALPASVAFGAGTTDDATPPEKTETTTKCEEGFVWVEEDELCVAIEDLEGEEISPEASYRWGRELAYAGRFGDAIAVLARADVDGDPRLLNYLGFAHRKLGQGEVARAYYEAALALDPDYHAARSYRGQGYVEDGRVDLALLDLQDMRARGGRDTYAYRLLKDAIARAGGASGY